MKNKECYRIAVPGSKSVINRLLTIASYALHPVTIQNGSSCADVQSIIQALVACGMDVHEDANITLSGRMSGGRMEVQDAGTAYRFLLARVASQPGFIGEIIPSPQLAKRPIKLLITALRTLGAQIIDQDYGFVVHGTQLKGGTIFLDGSISSQFVSALLMIAPAYASDVHLCITGTMVSQPYISMTIVLMHKCGVEVQRVADGYVIAARQKYRVPPVLLAEPDFSSAAYFWALGALMDISVETACESAPFLPYGSLQPDAGFLHILTRMGADVQHTADGIMVKRKELRGIDVDMRNMPDQVPTLAVLALSATGPSRIHGVEHLRYKESDRLSALITELSRIGAEISYNEKQLVIKPLANEPKPAILRVYDDHRLAMAFGVLAARYSQVSIDNRECVQKSYPEYWQEMDRIH